MLKQSKETENFDVEGFRQERSAYSFIDDEPAILDIGKRNAGAFWGYKRQKSEQVQLRPLQPLRHCLANSISLSAI